MISSEREEGESMTDPEEIVLNINGVNYDIEVEPRRSLVEVLRETLGLTGTKKSCNEGECGACTVLIDGRPVASCLVLAVDAQGKEIVTIEGLSEGEKLHPIQEAFLKHGCTGYQQIVDSILAASSMMASGPGVEEKGREGKNLSEKEEPR